MEKTIVFLPIIIFFGFFGLLVIGFLALVATLFFKAKAQEWEGEVIDKIHHINAEKNKNGPKKTTHLYSLKVKLDNGEIHNIPATADFYEKINVGDRLKKEKGALWPKKIS